MYTMNLAHHGQQCGLSWSLESYQPTITVPSLVISGQDASGFDSKSITRPWPSSLRDSWFASGSGSDTCDAIAER